MAAERLSCLARNGRSPGEESLATAIAAQAIEAQPSFGQIEPSGAAWFARSDSYPRRTRGGYRAIRTRGRVHRAKKKKPLRRDGRFSCCRPNGRQRARIMVGIGSTEVAGWLAAKRCNKRTGSGLDDRKHVQANSRREACRRNLSGRRRQRGERPHASGNARPASFGADKVMRAHAIVATMIAPAIAMTSRQPSMGTRRWASPCAA
jgi:hypothetical protein